MLFETGNLFSDDYRNLDMDSYLDEEPANLMADCMEELKEAAFEYLRLNPGTEFGDWQQGLISDCPAEVVDALGTDPEQVYASLADLWETDYCDPDTGIEQRFSEWALAFATENAVDLYYRLAEALTHESQ